MRRRCRRITLDTTLPARRQSCRHRADTVPPPLLPVPQVKWPDPYLLGDDWVAALAAYDADDALKPVPHLVSASHQFPKTRTKSFGKLEQVQVGGVGLPATDRADLFGAEATAGCGDIVLGHSWFGLAHVEGCGLSQRSMVWREGFGLSWSWHGRELYASGHHAESQYIAYCACRQSSAPHFGRFS